MSELQPGTVLDHYIVERKLGGGGMATVYAVRHQALRSLHALKVLSPELVKQAEVRERFINEGRIQANLKHPNIVAVTGVVSVEDVPGFGQVAGLVMEYLEGESLEAFIRRHRTPPAAEQVRELFSQVLTGVGFAHASGVIHRDIKPANLFLQRFHEQTVVRVLDFGIARVLGAEGTRLTQTGAFMGTCCYMSPEQLRGESDLTPRSDIFALGATLYELATRRICFDGDNLFAIMERIRSGQYVPPEQAHPGIDPGLAVTIKRALAQEPEQRFQDCAAFRTALQQPASVASVVSSPPTARTSGGRRAVWAMGLGGGAVAALFVARSLTGSTPPPAPLTPAPSEAFHASPSRAEATPLPAPRDEQRAVAESVPSQPQAKPRSVRTPAAPSIASEPARAPTARTVAAVVPAPEPASSSPAVAPDSDTPAVAPPKSERAEVVPARAEAPSRAPAAAPLGRFVVSGDTVRDTKSGLTWQRAISEETYTWEQAKAYCDQQGGGWRLPPREALGALFGEAGTRQEVLPLLTGPRTGRVWSVNPFTGAMADYVWTANLGTGELSGGRAQLPFRVLCVK